MDSKYFVLATHYVNDIPLAGWCEEWLIDSGIHPKLDINRLPNLIQNYLIVFLTKFPPRELFRCCITIQAVTVVPYLIVQHPKVYDCLVISRFEI